MKQTNEERILRYLTTISPSGASLGTLQASCRGYRDLHPFYRTKVMRKLLESGGVVKRVEVFAEKYFINLETSERLEKEIE